MGLFNSDATDENDQLKVVVSDSDDDSLTAEVTSEKRLKTTTTVTEVSADLPPPSVSNNFVVDVSGTEITIGASYTNIYTYNGQGKFFGAKFEFDNDNVDIRFTIDSQTILELNIDGMKDITPSDFPVCRSIVFHLDQFEFCPEYPIRYESQVQVQARTSGREMKRSIVILTKE